MLNVIKEKRKDTFINEKQIQNVIKDLKEDIKKIEVKVENKGNELEEKIYNTFDEFYDKEIKGKDSKIKEIKIHS